MIVLHVPTWTFLVKKAPTHKILQVVCLVNMISFIYVSVKAEL